MEQSKELGEVTRGTKSTISKNKLMCQLMNLVIPVEHKVKNGINQKTGSIERKLKIIKNKAISIPILNWMVTL